MAPRTIRVRTRLKAFDCAPRHVSMEGWDPLHVAVVVCDMWNSLRCVSATTRVAEIAPLMNQVLGRLREQGALIVHAPADCAAQYEGSAARERAMVAAHVDAPMQFTWNPWNPEREAPLLESLANPAACSCAAEPCCDGTEPQPWTCQTPLISIDPLDAVTEDGQELFNLLESRNIEDVVVMGVHANVCVLARSYGIRQLVYLGKRPLLCRDLTDSYHRDTRGHAWGMAKIIEHIECYWCPTVTSSELVGR